MHHPRTLLNLFDDRAELQIIFAQEEEILCGGILHLLERRVAPREYSEWCARADVKALPFPSAGMKKARARALGKESRLRSASLAPRNWEGDIERTEYLPKAIGLV